MPFFMTQWTYKAEEVKAMLVEPQDRREMVRLAIQAFGGTLHQMFFTFGEYDGVAITEFPDNATAKACLISIVGAGGLGVCNTTVLMTTEEAAESMKKAKDLVTGYQSPSGRD